MQPASVALSESLSTAELLAQLFPDAPASSWARGLEDVGGLGGLLRCSERQLTEQLGHGNLMRMRAAFELVRRARNEFGGSLPRLKSPHDIRNYLEADFAQARCERFIVIGLDARHTVLKKFIATDGGVDQCSVDPRQVFGPLVEMQATQFILAHNHPSGDPEPSTHDIVLTKQLAESGRLLCLKLVDHIIMAGNEFCSLLQRGHLSPR